MRLDALIAKWSGSSGAERANKDSFVHDLCDALGVPHPTPTTGDPAKSLFTSVVEVFTRPDAASCGQ